VSSSSLRASSNVDASGAEALATGGVSHRDSGSSCEHVNRTGIA